MMNCILEKIGSMENFQVVEKKLKSKLGVFQNSFLHFNLLKFIIDISAYRCALSK
jgi:galactitol-specific phosphotransferase system IIC component